VEKTSLQSDAGHAHQLTVAEADAYSGPIHLDDFQIEDGSHR
jgi:hypothetical protein